MSSVTQQLVECFLVVMHDKESIHDTELVLAAREADKGFSLATPAKPVKKAPIRGGGVHSL